jgi:leader peptidase (prepilin peptidase)/N-methyltransferase
MCGLFLGFKLTLLMLFLSFIIGGLSGVILIAAKKKSKKDYIPFGPFISIAAIITILFGNEIINLYISFL